MSDKSVRNPPEYIQWDDKEREGFLSRIGTFSPSQRNLFHELCRNYREEIPVKLFISNHALNIRNAEQELINLMNKLCSEGAGFLRVDHTDGSAGAVVLTDKRDVHFFTGLITEEYNRLSVYPEEPFLSRKYFEEKYIPIPDHYVAPLDDKSLSAILKGENYPGIVYEVTTAKDKRVIASGPVLVNMFNYASHKIRNALSNPETLSLIAELKDTSLLDIRKRTSKKDEILWLDIAKTILKNIERFHPRKKYNVGVDFFQAASLCVLVLKNRLQDTKKREEEEKKRDSDMDGLAGSIKNRGLEPCTPLDFSKLTEELRKTYGNKFQTFISEFHTRYTSSKGRRKLPVILIINHQYIHRDNLFPYFENRLNSLREELKREYISIMDKILRTNNREGKGMFYSYNAFSSDIGSRIAVLDPFVGSLFKRPDITAEGLIHDVMGKKKIKSKDDIKRHMEKFFLPGTIEFRGYPELLGLAILEIFDSAFARLPVWRQILIKISGKYDTVREKYTQRSKKKIPVERLKKHGDYPAVAAPRIHRASKRDKSGKVNSAASGKKKTEVKKRSYTKKELESAWKEFEKIIK
jgi:hypothetical protein